MFRRTPKDYLEKMMQKPHVMKGSAVTFFHFQLDKWAVDGQPPNYVEVMTYATDAWNPAKIGKAPGSAEWRAPIQVATTQADTPPVRGQFRRTSGDLDLLAFGFAWVEVLKGNTPEWELTAE